MRTTERCKKKALTGISHIRADFQTIYHGLFEIDTSKRDIHKRDSETNKQTMGKLPAFYTILMQKGEGEEGEVEKGEILGKRH